MKRMFNDELIKQDTWDRFFLELCITNSNMSKDPSTKVGSVIVGPDREVRATGFNGFPRGIADTTERLNNRDEKLKLVVHAEMNAILAAARVGTPLKGCSLYIIAHRNGNIWGGPPCTRCIVEIIQAGITQIIVPPMYSVPNTWHHDYIFSKSLLSEAGISYREISFKEKL